MESSHKLKVEDQVVTIYCDNNNVIPLFSNEVYNEMMQHIDIKLYFATKDIARGSVKVMVIKLKLSLVVGTEFC